MKNLDHLANSMIEFLVDCSTRKVKGEAEFNFHSNNPRFLALSKMEGRILDLGAGDGGLGSLLNWPAKQDGKTLIGCDLWDLPDLPKGYSDWIAGGWEALNSKNKHGGVFCIHVIEHLTDWREMLTNVCESLEIGGTIYIEWPCSETINWPEAEVIWSQFEALTNFHGPRLLTTSSFFDDKTHTSAPPINSEVANILKNFKITENSIIQLLDDSRELATYGIRNLNTADVTMGVWSYFGFAQYISAEKIY
jgi:2-polyprenyl-3-methyl-5-hydroxy-6-metoxy-1,4-benzoquinol methylase